MDVHQSFDAVKFSRPLTRKTLPKHNVSTSMFDGGDGVLGFIGSIPPPTNTVSCVDAKELDFGLIWPQHFHPVLLWIIGKLQTVLYMQSCSISVLHSVVCYQLFSWWLWCQLPWLEIIDKILPCNSGPIPHRSHDQWNYSRWDLAPRGAPARLTVILCCFHLRIITPTVVPFSPSCLVMVL